MVVLEVKNLNKYFRQHFWTASRKVLDSVSFHVNRGEIFGFLGPNGAGKSTTIKILFEIIFPSSGEATLFGLPVGDRESKKRIGFLPENPYFYEYLTAREFLRFHGKLWGMSLQGLEKRISEVLELVGMKGTDNLRLRNFSKGMLQRIGLAQSLLHNPDLVILDEPMTGLDPVGRKEVRDLMLHLKAEGKTVFFSTHILSDVESVCDRVAIMNKGKLLSCGTLSELISIDTKYAEFVWNAPLSKMKPWLAQHSLEPVVVGDTCLVKVFPKSQETLADFETRLSRMTQDGLNMGARLRSLSHRQDSLEDTFVKQIGVLESRI